MGFCMVRIDTYDENMNPTGSEERDVVHRRGLWHRNVYVVVVSPFTRDILLFLRDKKKAASGSHWAAIGEHPQKGEQDLVEVAQRGISEDMGLDIVREQVIDVGLELKVRLTDTKTLKDYEFQNYFAIRWDGNPSELKLGPENSEARFVRPYEIGKPPYVVPLGNEYLGKVTRRLVKTGLIGKKDLRKPGNGGFFAGLIS